MNTYADRNRTSKSDMSKNETSLFLNDDIKIDNLAENVRIP